MEKLFNDLSERTGVAEKLLNCLRESFSAIQSRHRNVDLVRKSVVGRMTEGEHHRDSLEKRLKALEESEKEIVELREGKKRKLASEEEELRLKGGELLNDFILRKEELDQQLASVREHIEWLEVVHSEVQGIRRQAYGKLKEIESQEQSLTSARELLAERERKVDSIIGRLDERVNLVEKREEEFDFFLEGKMTELALKEEKLSMQWEEFVKEVKLADEKLKEQERLRQGFIERLELAENRLQDMSATVDERLKEMEHRENVAGESVAVSVKEVELIRESVEEQLNEFDKMKTEFISLQEDKMQELVSKEQQLDLMNKELIKDSRLIDEQLTAREKLGHGLLKRLESAQVVVEDLKKLVHKRFKQIGLKETELNSISDWVEKKMDEVDSKAKELEERENRAKIMEDNLISKEKDLQGKKEELDLKERNLKCWQKDLDVKQREVDLAQESNEQRLEELDWREKNLNSVREFTRSCFKEHRVIKKQLQLERELVERQAGDLKHKEQKLECFARELEFEEKRLKDHVKELELKQQQLTDMLNAHEKFKSDESVDIKFIVRMDGKTLQMFLNDPEKDLGSMGDEIFKVLHLSSDPAKLVLDAMVGFYPPHLRKGDVRRNVRKTCIVLLEQLIRMSLKIQAYVREEAIELARAWKTKMGATAENRLEVLGFLHLLAAYNLASFFDKDEISSFLVMVAEHRQTLELRRLLGFAERLTDEGSFVQLCGKRPKEQANKFIQCMADVEVG